ncbi:NADH dehydrogenase, FAD-containing subunit [Rhodococcus rhodochrous J3]|uniref:NADH dehydrogenase, FAD-containing subunit n=1 Tax=Rhodococcus rhodochrous J3 TaxID=903528 RepID=A0ABY1MBT2_RHORH|nr:FAD-dependent oxidoreductase [Rhodococcus rhodochrous]MCB8912908.1 FAD-dependent oxidoreductase [Rhodococcus rhodochrous]SMG33431.1 NADH dehydrogenase, FAD-containing subunit [Rhodococcus rhodochrous J3]
MTTQFHVVVVGAGYAGVMTANRLLAEHPEVAVTVVNPRPVFVERVRLHQVAAGSGTATHELSDLLHPRATLHVGSAVRIEPHAVSLADGTVLRCDAVVYAVGSTSGSDTIPGAEKTFAVADLDSATALHDALLQADDHTSVVVIGGGLTGLETVTELAQSHPRHTLVLVGDPGAGFPANTQRYIRRRLDELGVEVLSGRRVTRVDDGSVALDDGAEIPATLVVRTAGFSVPDLARRSGLPVDEHGRLRVRDTLQAVDGTPIVGVGDSMPIVGVGDAVAVEGNDHLRMSCQAAMPLGSHGADTVWQLLQGREPAPLSLGFVSTCISLGRDRGVVQLSARDDTPSRWAVRGRLAAPVKEAVVRGTIHSMQQQARGRSLPTRRGPDTAAREKAHV